VRRSLHNPMSKHSTSTVHAQDDGCKGRSRRSYYTKVSNEKEKLSHEDDVHGPIKVISSTTGGVMTNIMHPRQNSIENNIITSVGGVHGEDSNTMLFIRDLVGQTNDSFAV
jgi:hypothetical protein